MQTIRLGEIMMEMDLLDEQQIEQILTEQRDRGGTFGEIAERLFDIHPEDVEFAWASQFRELTGICDIRDVDVSEDAVQCITRRQAWQFSVLPISKKNGELLIATTVENLARALRFVTRTVDSPCSFVITEPVWLGEALQEHYPMAGLTSGALAG